MISREAADSQKGFRLQKIRAISLMLDLITTVDKPHIYSATEYYEDIYVRDATLGRETEIFEENKNYSPDSKFTINSHEVKNSIVSFIDIWLSRGNGMSEKMFFNFYATNKIGQERVTEFSRKNNIILPQRPLLEYLQQQNITNDILVVVKRFIVEEYRRQYEKKENQGYFDVIQKWTIGQWQNFFSKIYWSFGQDNEVELKKRVLDQISKCKYFSVHYHSGYADLIFSKLMEVFDSRCKASDPIDRFVYGADVENIFLNIRPELSNNRQLARTDEVWRMWDALPEPIDKRNLSDKILAVCPTFTPHAIEWLSVKVTRNYVETEPFKSDKNFLSYRYRIYEVCRDTLDNLLKKDVKEKTMNESDIESWINTLQTTASQTIAELSMDYYYHHQNSKMIEGVILELFDTCFLSFDYAE